MSDRRRVSDDELDRTLASLVDGEPSRAFRAAVMRRLTEGPMPRRTPAGWRWALAGASGVALLAVAVGLWSLSTARPVAPERASVAAITPAPAAVQPPPPTSPGGPQRQLVVPRRAPRTLASARAAAPAIRASRQGFAAPEVLGAAVLAGAGVTVTDATQEVVQILVTPLPVPDPLHLAPLAPAVVAAGRPPAPPETGPAPNAPPNPLSTPLHVAPLTFESLKLENVNVPPLTLPPPPGEPDIKGKIR